MRDFFTALALIWCLYNTWELRHNFKFDKMSNILDQATLKVLKVHCKRLDVIEDALGIEHEDHDFLDPETLEACEDLIMFGDSKFFSKYFPDDIGCGLFDLIAKYGLKVVLDAYVDYVKGK